MSEPALSRHRLTVLSIAALGVVFGDIGTSPIYALRESFNPKHGLSLTEANVLGVLSLVLWSLLLVITLKYLVFILRADNEGEGGILALASLATPIGVREAAGRPVLVVLGLAGTALLFGDGAITPAVSVLSAVEGLSVVTPAFTPYVVGITVVILVALFAVQRIGTGRVGGFFGPVMLLWLTALFALGLAQVVREPSVLRAFNPQYAWEFFAANGLLGFAVLGSVFLVITGGEALYADLGHFGPAPIRRGWLTVVLPALLMNYLGQGAFLIRQPGGASDPFFLMMPRWTVAPMVVLATAATVIASQALITGAFSLAMQAVRLGLLPRVAILHTSDAESGQIYIPAVNWALLLACIGLVLGFGSSTALAGAYGVAVTSTMVLTTILYYVVARERWGWRRRVIIPLAAAFLVIDLAFWLANLAKVPEGGWFPLVVGAFLLGILLIWRRGRHLLRTATSRGTIPVADFAASLSGPSLIRVPGTAIFMISEPGVTPPALLHNLKHNRVLHDRVLLLTVMTATRSHVPPAERVTSQEIGAGVAEVVIRLGYRDDPDVPAILREAARSYGLRLTQEPVTYFLARETVVHSKQKKRFGWRTPIFEFLNRNARPASSFFGLPPNRVVELGQQVEL